MESRRPLHAMPGCGILILESYFVVNIYIKRYYDRTELNNSEDKMLNTISHMTKDEKKATLNHINFLNSAGFDVKILRAMIKPQNECGRQRRARISYRNIPQSLGHLRENINE